jgi:mannan endo-1,4-beta-mannosidase
MKDGKLDTSNSNAAFQTIKSDLDKVAALLQLLKDRDIPVLWRPLHEASGGWFWWGATGARPYKALWEYMYNYLTNVKKLNNLIWVWNGQSYDWYPNANTVDIVGYDYYTDARTAESAQNYSSQQRTFDTTLRMVPETNRMVALTENGAIPNPDLCKADDAMWPWFLTWNDARNTVGETHRDNFWTGEYHNTQSHKTHVYNHALVITLDELPDLTAYRLE